MTDYLPFVQKYRPKTIRDVVGQRVAAGYLESALNAGELAPTLLLSGPYGTGKTTLSRIIARHLLCLNDGACGDCRACKMLDRDAHPDYQEINAASERGIETVRNIRDLTAMNPVQGKYRIICFDEAHQMTGPAQQALLKILEDGAKRHIFIMCSTDHSRILPTIKSRCQHIKLQLVTPVAMMKLLNRVNDAEELNFPEDVLDTVAKLANGHPRDAVMMLEQVKQYAKNNNVASEELATLLPKIVEEMTELPPEAIVSRYMQELINGSYKAVGTVQQVDNPARFFPVALKYIKGLLFEMKGLKTKDHTPEYKLFITQTKFTREYDASTLLRIYECHLNGLERTKRYESDAADILDLTVMQSLEVTTQNQKHKKE